LDHVFLICFCRTGFQPVENNGDRFIT
jgi:hypothetical protein